MIGWGSCAKEIWLKGLSYETFWFLCLKGVFDTGQQLRGCLKWTLVFDQVLLPALLRHVCLDRTGGLQRTTALRLHPHLQRILERHCAGKELNSFLSNR